MQNTVLFRVFFFFVFPTFVSNEVQTDQTSPIDEFLEKHRDSLSDEEKKMFKLCTPDLQAKYKKMGKHLPAAAVVHKMKTENPNILKGSKQKQAQPSLLDGMKNLKSVADTCGMQHTKIFLKCVLVHHF